MTTTFQMFGSNEAQLLISETIKNSVYLIQNDSHYDFNSKLYIVFPVYSIGTYIKPRSKMNIEINLYLKFNDNIVPDFNLDIYEDDILKYSEPIGVDWFPNKFNKLQDNIIVDIYNITKISIQLSKKDTRTSNVTISKNSYYSIKNF